MVGRVPLPPMCPSVSFALRIHGQVRRACVCTIRPGCVHAQWLITTFADDTRNNGRVGRDLWPVKLMPSPPRVMMINNLFSLSLAPKSFPPAPRSCDPRAGGGPRAHDRGFISVLKRRDVREINVTGSISSSGRTVAAIMYTLHCCSSVIYTLCTPPPGNLWCSVYIYIYIYSRAHAHVTYVYNTCVRVFRRFIITPCEVRVRRRFGRIIHTPRGARYSI